MQGRPRPRPQVADSILLKFLQEAHHNIFLQGATMKGLRAAATRHAWADMATGAQARRCDGGAVDIADLIISNILPIFGSNIFYSWRRSSERGTAGNDAAVGARTDSRQVANQ